jgi:hypothetical protein
MQLTKKAHKQISRPKAGFNDTHKPPGCTGKDGAGEERVWARRDFLYKREGKRLAHAQGSLMGVELG